MIVTDLSWRVMFYINVPVCVAAVVAAYRVAMPGRTAGAATARLDVAGLALLSPGLAAIIYGLAQAGGHAGFAAPAVVWPVIGGVALLMTFAVHALRSRDPIIDLRLFRSRSFSAASALLLLFTMAMLGIQLLLPLYYQQIRHESTLAYTQVSYHTSTVALSAVLVANGAGIGAALVPSLAAPYRGLRTDQIPRATSAIRILQQLGGSLGVAVLAVVLQRALVQQAHHAASLAAAYGQTFWWALASIALAAIPAMMLPGTLARRQLEPSPAAA